MARSTTALGLGLPLAKRLELHGGRLEIDSRPGVGTTIAVSLPRLGDARALPLAEGEAAPKPATVGAG